MAKPRLQIIIASTRPGRVGLPVATWFAGAARQHNGFEVAVVDLAEVNLPLLDEPNHPRLRQYTHDHTQRWSETIERGDAYVVVHPEYNYSFNAALKNALDYLHHEWHDKAVGFVSYGGVSGGLRAASALRQVVTALKMVPVTDAVVIPWVSQHVRDGEFMPPEPVANGAKVMLDELIRITAAMAALGAAR